MAEFDTDWFSTSTSISSFQLSRARGFPIYFQNVPMILAIPNWTYWSCWTVAMSARNPLCSTYFLSIQFSNNFRLPKEINRMKRRKTRNISIQFEIGASCTICTLQLNLHLLFRFGFLVIINNKKKCDKTEKNSWNLWLLGGSTLTSMGPRQSEKQPPLLNWLLLSGQHVCGHYRLNSQK